MIKIQLIFLLILCTSCASWFDGNREGIFVTIGAGASNLTAEYSGEEDMDTTIGTLGTKVGWGFGERLSVMVAKTNHFYSSGGEDVLSETSALGIQLYILQNLYVYGASGITNFSNEVSESAVDNFVTGTGTIFGLGYNFAKHYSFEVSVSAAELDQEDITESGLTAPTIQNSTSFMIVGQVF